MTTREAADRGYMMAVPALDVSEEEERMKIRMTNWRKRSRTSYDPVDESLDKFAKDSCKYPLVHFPTANAHLLCVPNIFDVKNAKGHTEASREQVSVTARSLLHFVTISSGFSGTSNSCLGAEHP